VTRAYRGIQVIDLPVGSKPAALSAGDVAADGSVRVYLDADIQITANAMKNLITRNSQDLTQLLQ